MLVEIWKFKTNHWVYLNLAIPKTCFECKLRHCEKWPEGSVWKPHGTSFLPYLQIEPCFVNKLSLLCDNKIPYRMTEKTSIYFTSQLPNQCHIIGVVAQHTWLCKAYIHLKISFSKSWWLHKSYIFLLLCCLHLSEFWKISIQDDMTKFDLLRDVCHRATLGSLELVCTSIWLTHLTCHCGGWETSFACTLCILRQQ